MPSHLACLARTPLPTEVQLPHTLVLQMVAGVPANTASRPKCTCTWCPSAPQQEETGTANDRTGQESCLPTTFRLTIVEERTRYLLTYSHIVGNQSRPFSPSIGTCPHRHGDRSIREKFKSYKIGNSHGRSTHAVCCRRPCT